MSWPNLQDTLLNVGVFVFIGWLVWLYLKPTGIDRENGDDS